MVNNEMIDYIIRARNELREHMASTTGGSRERQEAKELLSGLCNSIPRGAWAVVHAYEFSQQNSFDEIVFNTIAQSELSSDDIDDVVWFCRKAKIEQFVFAGRGSDGFQQVALFQDSGMKVGKFVVKECADLPISEGCPVRVAGIRLHVV